jgi:hypothetical protein
LQLDFGEILRVNLLSVSALADARYATLFRSGHVFMYIDRADPVEPQLIGDRVDRLYIVKGQPTVGDSESDEEQEAPEIAVSPMI